MDLSLIISTRNRADSLSRTLHTIEQLEKTSANWELVVVDNGSTDQTAEILQAFANKTSLNVSTVIESNAGLANARNAGVKNARGELLVFTDDDCLPDPDFIEQWLGVLNENLSIGFAGGRILLHDPTDQRITIQEHTQQESICPGDFIEPGLIQGANFAFRRKALIEAGGFDPFFGAGAFYSVEDIDSVARVSANGWQGVYDPRPLVYHAHGRKTLADVRSLENSYALGRGAYYAKCMLQRRWSKQAWKHWYWTHCRKPFNGIRKELMGGFTFLCRNFYDNGRRFRKLDFDNGATSTGTESID